MTRKMRFYVGTYTQPIKFGTGQILEGKGEGIYLIELDMESGSLSNLGLVAKTPNPSYLIVDANKKYLYAVNELKEYQGEFSGSVTSFEIVPDHHHLLPINTRPTVGTDPCHVALSKNNTHLFVSNFMSGSVCVFPIDADGSIKEKSDFIQHVGSSINKDRQKSPHAHSLTFDPENSRAIVPDLGIDKLMIYDFDEHEGRLIPSEIPWYSVSPGAGPRTCEFGRSGEYCYLINEIANSISVLAYDKLKGRLEEIQVVPSLANSFDGDNTCADLQLTPDGRFLYGSNRGHNSIIVYSINSSNGRLTYVDTTLSEGETPRSFTIEPTGHFLLVCNQDSDNIVVFSIDQETGKLLKKDELFIPTPVCVKSI
ncbi:MAG: lactonase family protein [Clostridiaceae bacterium]